MNLITQRLELVPATFELIHADLKGRPELARLLNAHVPESWPPPLTLFTVMLWFKQQLQQSPHWAGWFSWYWILKSDRAAVGLGGFKGCPNAEGIVEIGYSVLPEFQLRGFATEAVSALTGWAFRHDEVKRVVAEARPDRMASIRVLEKTGFRRAGEDLEKGVLRFALERNRAPERSTD